MASAIDESSGLGAFLATPLLSGMDEAGRVAVFDVLSEAPVPQGGRLLTQGEPNARLWFVAAGSVAVERTRPGGRVDVLGTLNGPAMYGTTTFFRSSSPSASIRAITPLFAWALDHPGLETLRRDDPRAAQALTLEVIRALSERFDQLDARLAELMAEHADDHPRATEWANFRARLFEEPSA